MKSIMVLVLVVTLAGCASMVREGALIRAQDSYVEGDYPDTIAIVDRALSSYDYDNEGKSQLLLLKAQSFEKMNDFDAALGTYHYIVERLPDTQAAYVIRQRLKPNKNLGPAI